MDVSKSCLMIPAFGRDDEDEWQDLRVLLTSWQSYGQGLPLIVGWRGRRAPRVPRGVRLVEQRQPENGFGPALRGLLSLVKEHPIILNDDLVLCPTSLPLLLEDLRWLSSSGCRPGVVGFRSNFVTGPQNIRFGAGALGATGWASEREVLEVPVVYGIGFWVSRQALEEIPDDWLQLHWFSDALLCFDLRQRAYRHFVSRGYVHHHGSRSGGVDRWEHWRKRGLAWLRHSRPDFFSEQAPGGGGGIGWASLIGAPGMPRST